MADHSTEQYFGRFGFADRQVLTPPPPDLGLVVVIPCFNEPDLLDRLAALWECESPRRAVEVIVVVNAPAGAPLSVRDQNRATLAAAARWSDTHRQGQLGVHLLDLPRLPAKRAGVGLARKIGLDEALRRLAEVGRVESGVLVSFDADCRCDPNYLVALDEHFSRNPETPGCSIYFEHPLAGPLPDPCYQAITLYELHLRFYVQALRYAQFPYSFHTVGSAMAVRAGVYLRQGGMNSRQAGEDFYFLHKVMPLGGYTDLVDTRVLASPRVSERVPFGTGRAVGDYLSGRPIASHPVAAFQDLRALFCRLDQWAACTPSVALAEVQSFSPALHRFLEDQGFSQGLAEVQKNTASLASFRRRIYTWFDGFRVMKFIHFARDQFYGAAPVEGEAAKLLGLLKPSTAGWAHSPRELLLRYRELDRSCFWAGAPLMGARA